MKKKLKDCKCIDFPWGCKGCPFDNLSTCNFSDNDLSFGELMEELRKFDLEQEIEVEDNETS